MGEIYIFWDNSNMFIPMQNIAEQRDGIMEKQNARLSFANLIKLAKANRSVIKSVAVGSIPPSQRNLWDRMIADTGLVIELYERGAESNSEQAVDQSLQVHMLRALHDEKEPKVAVLLTGDGKGAERGIGFLADMKRLFENGWGIEVLSWERACNRDLKIWAQNNGVFIPLDNYYDAITFIEGGRTAISLSLTARTVSKPRASLQTELYKQIEDLKAELKQREDTEKKQRQKAYGVRVSRRKKR